MTIRALSLVDAVEGATPTNSQKDLAIAKEIVYFDVKMRPK